MLAEDTGYFRTMSTLFLTPDSRRHLCNEVYSVLCKLFDNYKFRFICLTTFYIHSKLTSPAGGQFCPFYLVTILFAEIKSLV